MANFLHSLQRKRAVYNSGSGLPAGGPPPGGPSGIVIGQQFDSARARRFAEAAVERCKRKPAAHGYFEIGSVIRAQAVPAGEIKNRRLIVVPIEQDVHLREISEISPSVRWRKTASAFVANQRIAQLVPPDSGRNGPFLSHAAHRAVGQRLGLVLEAPGEDNRIVEDERGQ